MSVDITEKVARAILETDPTCNYDKCKQRLEKAFAQGDTLEKNWWESLHEQANNALSASGYREMREALEDLVQYMTARSEFEIGGDNDSHAAYASGVVHNARRLLNPDAPFERNVRAWTADDWARAKETQRMGRELLARLSPKEGT